MSEIVLACPGISFWRRNLCRAQSVGYFQVAHQRSNGCNEPMNSDTVSVERIIDADPSKIFALLADAGKHSSIDGSGTVQGSQRSSQPLSLGQKFGMSMKQGLPYKTSNTVIEFEPDRKIAWQTQGFGGLVGGRIWRYELSPTANGTLVQETWDIGQDKQRFLLKRSKLPAMTKRNMSRTLERIAEAVQ